jgi:YidC/Oxa1 family membrane protein insertase
MKTMNTTMPLLSLFMVTTLPTGIGIYWIFSAVVRIVQQIFINKHLKKLSIEDLIEKNKEKAVKKQAKRKENAERVNAMAQTSTKSINNSAKRTVNDSKNNKSKYANVNKPGSLASKANMVKKFNDNK